MLNLCEEEIIFPSSQNLTSLIVPVLVRVSERACNHFPRQSLKLSFTGFFKSIYKESKKKTLKARISKI